MKFGKLEDIKDVNFDLPEDDPTNSIILTNSNSNCQLYIGATAWTTKEWIGKLYPTKTPASDFLTAYAKHFNSIELNATYYHLPKRESILKWKDQVPDDFRFCPKVWKLISHRKGLSLGTDAISRFIDSIASFEDNLGISFIQLPPYFSDKDFKILEQFMLKWPREFKLAIELRHETFFKEPIFSRLVAACRELSVTLLITDVAGRRDIMHSSLTSPASMIRWVGNGLHDTDYTRCRDWVSRISAWAAMGIEEIYFFPHQPDNIFTPEISQYILKEVSIYESIISRGPKIMDSNNQLSLL